MLKRNPIPIVSWWIVVFTFGYIYFAHIDFFIFYISLWPLSILCVAQNRLKTSTMPSNKSIFSFLSFNEKWFAIVGYIYDDWKCIHENQSYHSVFHCCKRRPFLFLVFFIFCAYVVCAYKRQMNKFCDEQTYARRSAKKKMISVFTASLRRKAAKQQEYSQKPEPPTNRYNTNKKSERECIMRKNW